MIARIECDPAGLTQRDLARMITSDPNTVGSLLDRMESAGLVVRKPHEKDRRAHRIQLAASGRRKYIAARKIAIALQSEVLLVLPEADREPFLEHLAMVADGCRKAAGQPSGRRP